MCINKDTNKDEHKTTIYAKEKYVKAQIWHIFVITGLKTLINNMDLIGNSNIYHIKFHSLN